jgi:hypothetical protein
MDGHLPTPVTVVRQADGDILTGKAIGNDITNGE